ncbi:mediator of RNA polymerase II transcription subunit 13 [Mortierella claussenii]|nr:mediator of RNA polymerase II transcription subunit 13 [Mortierella claussenii]
MLSCTINMYLSSSNLIFQPTFQYHRLRTLDAADLDPKQSTGKELSVILSPHGTPAVLKPIEMTEFTDEQAQKCLEDWEKLFGTNQEGLCDLKLSLPRLVAVSIKSGDNEILLQYPTERVFVAVSCKESPSDVGQQDGMGSRNLGFIEDLGAKFAMWSWQEKTRNAIASPAVPKLVQPISEHTPVLAEPKNRLKTGSNAWHQHQNQLLQQQAQQQQQQQLQQQQQTTFLQQQQESLVQRALNDTNRIDYWSYTDPHAYLTSVVLNSCANAEPRGADSPSANDNQTSVVIPTISSNKSSKAKSAGVTKPGGALEADGWIRKKPKRNTIASPKFNSFSSVDPPDTSQSAWSGEMNSTSMQASNNESNFSNADQFNNTTNISSSVKADAVQEDIQSANAITNSASYQLPIDIPNDSSDMMSGLMDMNSMLGLYGAGGSDDLGDWGEVTKDDFSFFDEQPQSIVPSRPLPMSASSAFDTQSSIPMTSAATLLAPGVSAIGSANGIMDAFSDMSDPFGKMMTTSSPLNDDSLFANMELDISSFTQPTPPASAILPLGVSEKLAASSAGSLAISPAADHFIANQLPHDIGILTPTPQGSLFDKESLTLSQQHQQHKSQLQDIPAALHVATSEGGLVKRPSLFVEYMNSPIQSYIPSSFSPLKIVGDYFVDDSKYQAGGQYVYRRLYKRRKSSMLSPFHQHRRELNMLPFYQPGKDQEWIAPARKDRSRRLKSRVFSLTYSWNSSKQKADVEKQRTMSGLAVIKQEEDRSGQTAADNKSGMSTTAWGISSLSLQPPENHQMEESSSSESDSDCSSTSMDDSDDESPSITDSAQPTFGTLTWRFLVENGNTGNKNANELWSVRGINSAKFVDALLARSTGHSIGRNLLGLTAGINSRARQAAPAVHMTEMDPEREGQRLKPWPSAEAYHTEVEFDTPFTPAILSAAPPALVHEPLAVQEGLAAEYFLEAVKTLCEQAVMGDYPFAGSNEVTGTSGEISEGESFHVMLARRKTMSEFLYNGVATVPALGDDSFRNMMEMKTIIFDLFDHLRGNQSENVVALPVPSDASQDMTMNMGSIHGHRHHSSQSNIIPPVVMKGPLTLFQYFSLAEAQQMPSKYGKYQVKKKKPAEPSLVQLPPPDIVVGHNEEWLEAAPTILRFWEKLSLEPYSSKKNISYFIVYPKGADMESAVNKFWKELSVVFETSLLGRHQPGTLQDYKPGLVPIDLLPAMPGESSEAQQVRSYVDGCQRLGSILGGSSLQKDIHTVIYMVNPFSHGAGYFDLCRCFSIMKTQFRTAALGSLLTPLEQRRERLVLQMVPIQHVIYPSTFGGYLRFGLRDIAFAVYTKCKLFLERPTYSRGVLAQINSYAPSFALAKTTPATIQYEITQKPNSVPKPPATLHVGYGFSLDGRWLVCVWTDHRGEMLEHMAQDMTDCSRRVMLTDQTRHAPPLESCLQEIWTRTLVYQKRGSFSWKTIICKLGLMTRLELQEWTRLTSGSSHTAIVALNIDSPLRMYPHNRGAEYLSSGMTPNASGINTPTAVGLGQSGTPMGGGGSLISTSCTGSVSSSTSDVSAAPATPIMANNVGAASLSMTGAAGTNVGSQSGGATVMGGIGGLSGSETLENGAGQVYAMILNHRIPLIVSRSEAGFGAAVASAAEDPERSQEHHYTETKEDILIGDNLLSMPVGGDVIQDQDIDMEPEQQPKPRHQQQKQQQGNNQDTRTRIPSTTSRPFGSDYDVILPLSTGYLIQVPVQSNSVMREKHSLEALGIEVHLLHLQRTPTAVSGSSSVSTTAVNTPVVSTSTLLSNYSSNSPYQQQSTAYHLQRHNAASPSTSGQPYRSASFSSSQYPGSPLIGSPSSTFLGGLPQAQQQQPSQQQPVGVMTVKATVAANTTREILKQFHALSHLSMAPVQINCLPNHLVLVERLSRVLLLVQDS